MFVKVDLYMSMYGLEEAKAFSKIGNSMSSISKGQIVNILGKDTILPL